MTKYLQRLRITTKLWLLIGVFALVGLADNLSELALINQRLHAEKEVQLRHLVEAAHSVVQAYQRAVREGRIAEDAARRLAAHAVREMHYGGREYFWIHDQALPVPSMVMHPTVPALEGQRLDAPRFDRATAMRAGGEGDYRTLAGANLFVAMNQASAQTGDGFVAYDWPKPLPAGGISTRDYPKLSYVKRFDPWGWVIGSGIYIDDLEAEYWRDVRARLAKAAVWLLLLGLVAWFVTRTIVRPLRVFQRTIDDLRANPNAVPAPPGDQPGELGQLTESFLGLMEDLRRSRNELATSIDRLRQAARAFSAMEEGVLITDAEGRIVSLNPAFSRLTGYEPEDLVGRSTAILRSDRHADDFYAALWSRLKADGQWSGTIWNRRKDGSVRPHWVFLAAARDPEGAVHCYVGLYAERPEAN